MKKKIVFLSKLSIKTLYFNFKYFPFKVAIKFPILISKHVLLKQISGKIHFDCKPTFGLVHIGFGEVGVFDVKNSRSIWEVYGTITFKGKASFGQGSKITVAKEGNLVIGDNFRITAESTIISYLEIIFGDNCLLSWEILIMDTDFHKINDENGQTINEPKSILIGNDVWIGCRALILKGVIIPNNVVIGAGSIVSKKLENENSIYAGSPVKLIKEQITWRP